MRIILITLCLAMLPIMVQAERIVYTLTPDEAVKASIRLGIDLLETRNGKQIYIIGVDAKEKREKKTFEAFTIVIQKPRSNEVELTARMWHQEWPEGVLYTTFEIEESFLPFLYVLVDYGKYRDGITYRIPVRPYLTRKQDNLPEGLQKTIAEQAEENAR